MIVCFCRGVSDQEIRRAVRRGARTPNEVARACGAGTGCGGCAPDIETLLSLEPHAPATVREAEPG